MSGKVACNSDLYTKPDNTNSNWLFSIYDTAASLKILTFNLHNRLVQWTFGQQAQQPQSYAFNDDDDDDDALFSHNAQYHRQIDGQRDRQHSQ